MAPRLGGTDAARRDGRGSRAGSAGLWILYEAQQRPIQINERTDPQAAGLQLRSVDPRPPSPRLRDLGGAAYGVKGVDIVEAQAA